MGSCPGLMGCTNCNQIGPYSDRERQILFDLTYMWYLKNKTKQKHKPRRKIVCGLQRPGVGGQGIGERWPKGTNFQL